MSILREYNLNQHLRGLADQWSSAPAIDRPKLLDKIVLALTESSGASVTLSTREYLFSVLKSELETFKSDFFEYQYNGAERGKTYLSVSGKDSKDNKISTVLLLKVLQQPKNKPKTEFSRNNFTVFERSFNRAFQAVQDLMKRVNPVIYFAPDFYDYLDFTITDRHGRAVEFSLEGESIELPFALAIFSVIAQRDLPASICSTGRIQEEKIISVNNTIEKFYTAVTEFDEIEKLLFPAKDPLREISPGREIDLIPIATLDNAVFTCFKDYKQIIQTLSIRGLVNYSVRKIIVKTDSEDIDGTELEFNIAEGDQLSTDYLSILYDLDLKDQLFGNQVLVFSNARASWHIGHLCAKYFNTITYLVVYDPKLKKKQEVRAGYVVTAKKDNPLKLGSEVFYTYAE